MDPINALTGSTLFREQIEQPVLFHIDDSPHFQQEFGEGDWEILKFACGAADPNPIPPPSHVTMAPGRYEAFKNYLAGSTPEINGKSIDTIDAFNALPLLVQGRVVAAGFSEGKLSRHIRQAINRVENRTPGNEVPYVANPRGNNNQ